MTWKDVKLATLQKMFAADGSTIPTDESTKDYLAGMPLVANEALNRLATAGKFILKSVVIAHNPLTNIVGNEKGLHTLGELEFNAVDAFSYYFEFTGKGTLSIKVDGVDIDRKYIESKGTYTEIRGIIPEGNGKVTIKISCNYPSAVKNFAMYNALFDEEKEVPQFSDKVRYNIKDYVDDFYQIADTQIYYDGGMIAGYFQSSDYYKEGDSIIVLDRDNPGSYTVYYRAYPPEITSATADDYELPIDREVAVLMPLYMASQLYKDDDNALATVYRNEFEVGLESLRDNTGVGGYEEFTSEGEW